MTATETPSQNFRNLYPEVDPTTPIRLGRGEHFAIVASTGILVFGAAAGDLRITGAGFALFLLSIIITASKTNRRIRHEARSRFPGEDWIEYRTARHLRTDIIVPVGWLIIQCDHQRMPLVCPRAIHLLGSLWGSRSRMCDYVVFARPLPSVG